MSETKDPAIKLFGKTIQLPLCEKNPVLLSNNEGETGILTINQDSDLSSANLKDKKLNSNHGEEQTYDKDSYETKENNGGLESPPILEELTITTTISSGVTDNPKSSSIEKEAVDKKSSRKEEGSETDLSQEKTLKKPDKILPCPRCNSMDTKFCYYNNYNVNQPRHFCKNCQRYWTAGGTMRNVPVGAGRRKNKNSTSLYRQLSVSEALQTTKAHIVDGIQHPSFKRNGTVLTFGSDSPLCDSMASVLSLTDQAMRNCTRNGLHRTEERKVIDSNGGLLLNEDENSSRCSTTEGSRVGIQDSAIPCHGFTPQMQCFPGPPWAYHPWNSTVSPPGFCASTFPIPIYPSNPYWACPVPGSWTVPWLPPLSSSPNSCPPTPSPFSPTLGKHSREGDILRPNPPAKEDHKISEENSEHCLWIPKTLRIDDPGEAARSSIWETLGIKNNPDESLSGGRLFKAFQSKVDEKKHKIEASPAFQANPAALSRSLNFQESSQLSC